MVRDMGIGIEKAKAKKKVFCFAIPKNYRNFAARLRKVSKKFHLVYAKDNALRGNDDVERPYRDVVRQ